jgi:hypothetical protein
LTTPAHVGWTGGGALLIPLSLGGRGWNGSLWIRFEHVRLLARRGGNWKLSQGADPLSLPLRIAKTGRNYLNEEFTPILPTGIGERF